MTAWRTLLRILRSALILALTGGDLPLWIVGRAVALLAGSPPPA